MQCEKLWLVQCLAQSKRAQQALAVMLAVTSMFLFATHFAEEQAEA